MNNIKAPSGRGEAEKGKTRRHFFLSLENAKARAYDRAQEKYMNHNNCNMFGRVV